MNIVTAFSLATLIDLITASFTTGDEPSPGAMAAAWQLGKRDIRLDFSKQVIFNSIPALAVVLLARPAEAPGTWRSLKAENGGKVHV